MVSDSLVMPSDSGSNSTLALSCCKAVTMSDGGGFTILDGSHLRGRSLTLPDSDGIFTGAQVIDLANSKAESALFGFVLPQTLRTSALERLKIDDAAYFQRSEFDRQRASSLLTNYIAAIADELKDDPFVVSVLDGSTLQKFLEDEDDFAMLAEDLFTELDTEDKGKIKKRDIRNAVVDKGAEMGIPPSSEFPLLNDIMEKHGVGEEEELGQSQFAKILQPILQEISEELAEKPVVVAHNVKIINGSKLRKVLASESYLNDVFKRILQEKDNSKDGRRITETVRDFLERNGRELGLPPSKADEAAVLLYDAVFDDVDDKKYTDNSDEDGIQVLVKEILQKFAKQLESQPVFHELDDFVTGDV